MDQEAVEWSREALELLEARLADMRGESTKTTRDAFVTDLAAAATPAEALQKTAGRLIGMLNLAFKLVIELEQASEQSAETWLAGLADWLTMIQAETGGGGGTDRHDDNPFSGLHQK